jgi:Cu/Ag efflux protein CusF
MKLVTLFAAAAIALTSTGATWAAEMTDGTIKKIDVAQNKVTIKHAELKALEMPSMTMVFFVGEGVDIAKLEVGQKIKFAADRVNGRITVTGIK